MNWITPRRLGLLAALGLVVVGLLFSSTASAQDPTVSIGSTTRSVGSEGTVTLAALDIGEPGVGAWTIQVGYDPAVVTIVDCEPGSGGICNEAATENTVRVVGATSGGLIGDSILASLRFRCEEVGIADLTLTVDVFVDATLGDPQPIDAAVSDGSVTCTEPGEPGSFPGDVNCDTFVNAIDATLILQYGALLIPSLECLENADVNCDTFVNAIDATLVLQYGALLIPSLEC